MRVISWVNRASPACKRTPKSTRTEDRLSTRVQPMMPAILWTSPKKVLARNNCPLPELVAWWKGSDRHGCDASLRPKWVPTRTLNSRYCI